MNAATFNAVEDYAELTQLRAENARLQAALDQTNANMAACEQGYYQQAAEVARLTSLLAETQAVGDELCLMVQLQEEQIAEAREALQAALEAADYMGDIANDMDIVEDADMNYCNPRFDKARDFLQRLEAGT